MLCGPLVRHCTPEYISLWFALEESTDNISVALFKDNTLQEPLPHTLQLQRLAIAQKCFIYKLDIQIDYCENNSLIYYDIKINGKGFRETGLNQVICFPNEALPSIPLTNKHKFMLQASCRKPQTGGSEDQLSYATYEVRTKLNKTSRPTQLYLTGDQIYADDVSPVMLDYLHRLSDYLGFEKETIRFNQKSVNPRNTKLNTRDYYCNKQKGFTTEKGSSHLMSFSEYACMYLTALGGNNVSIPTFIKYSQLRKRLNQESKNAYPEKSFKKDRKAIREFERTIQSDIRRLLANISTYMIFDDHEVTDDWNLTKTNHHRLQTSDIGQAVQLNALSSYFIFQHWGNQHKHTDISITDISNFAQKPTATNRKKLKPLTLKYWGYTLQQSPPAIILDTRTQRVFNGRHLSLMSLQKLDQLGSELKDMTACESLLVISPTPVYGFTAIEAIQLKLDQKSTLVDREPWIADRKAFHALQQNLTKLPNVKHILIFSGDVHYAFTRKQYLKSKDVSLWQFCSSASNNKPTGSSVGIRLAHFIAKAFIREKTRYMKPEGNKHFLTSDKNIGLLELDDNLLPENFILRCRKSDNKTYTKRYQLKKFLGRNWKKHFI